MDYNFLILFPLATNSVIIAASNSLSCMQVEGANSCWFIKPTAFDESGVSIEPIPAQHVISLPFCIKLLFKIFQLVVPLQRKIILLSECWNSGEQSRSTVMLTNSSSIMCWPLSTLCIRSDSSQVVSKTLVLHSMLSKGFLQLWSQLSHQVNKSFIDLHNWWLTLLSSLLRLYWCNHQCSHRCWSLC